MTETSRRAGHGPTLAACFLHFDLSFMLWVLVGALGVFVASSLELGPAQKALVVAVPILSGSILRIPFGVLSDWLGARRVGVALLAFLFLPLSLGWLGAGTFRGVLLTGTLLGAAGASFAVALPLASRWYPPERQGMAMGVAAAGNSGTVLTNLVAPRLAAHLGWHAVFGLAMVPLALVLVAFGVLARESPRPSAPPSGDPAAQPAAGMLGRSDLWWLCLFYAVTFGGYVGLSSFLPIFFRDQYGVAPVVAGGLTAACAFAGSGARPIGGWLADRVGGVGLLSLLLVAIAAAYALISRLPALPFAAGIAVAGMACLGMANGAVFQIVPQRFPGQIGRATGIIGALGGLGGFALPMLLGTLKARWGSFGAGFAVLAGVALLAAVALRVLAAGARWRPAGAGPVWPPRRLPT
jgi:NNP family nitrate/nitrite transporter-like MFS transporter